MSTLPVAPAGSTPVPSTAVEAPAERRRRDEEQPVDGIAIGVGDGQIQLDILEGVARTSGCSASACP